MARQFVNLSPYEAAQINRRASMVNPLDAALQGLQQGVQLQQLPQTLQDQALARQLQNAINTQQLQDLQNPEAALARKLTQELTLRGALNPDLGIQAAPAGLVGQTIANPGAITAQQQAALPSVETLALRDAARAAGGVDIPTVIPTAAAGLPETPISVFGIQTGLNTNPNIPIRAADDKLERQIQLANSRVRSAGVQGQFIPDGLGGMIFAQKPTTPGGEVQTTRVSTPEGQAVVVAPRASAATASRGLTANARLDMFKSLGKAGLPLDEKVSISDEERMAYNAAFKNKGNASEDDIRKEFAKLPVVKSFNEINRQIGIMRTAYDKLKDGGSKGPIDQALITTYNKILDPDSVVRESEYSRTPEGAALIRRIEGRLEQYTKGGVAFTDAERKDLLDTAEALFASSEATYKETEDFYKGIVKRRGGDVGDVFKGSEPAPKTDNSALIDRLRKTHNLP